jgi:hypothetical protein
LCGETSWWTRPRGAPSASGISCAACADGVEGARLDARHAPARERCEVIEDLPREQDDVVAALAQGGYRQRHDRDAVIEVAAEIAPRHHVGEVAVRRHEDARPELERARRAEPLETPLLQHPQELRLAREAELPDLVEQHRAALGGLEHPRARRERAGERAALVPEELALDQGLGDGGAVDHPERRPRARAGLVDEARDERLARAALAEQEHGGVAARELGNELRDALGRGRAAEEALRAAHGELPKGGGLRFHAHERLDAHERRHAHARGDPEHASQLLGHARGADPELEAERPRREGVGRHDHGGRLGADRLLDDLGGADGDRGVLTLAAEQGGARGARVRGRPAAHGPHDAGAILDGVEPLAQRVDRDQPAQLRREPLVERAQPRDLAGARVGRLRRARGDRQHGVTDHDLSSLSDLGARARDSVHDERRGARAASHQHRARRRRDLEVSSRDAEIGEREIGAERAADQARRRVEHETGAHVGALGHDQDQPRAPYHAHLSRLCATAVTSASGRRAAADCVATTTATATPAAAIVPTPVQNHQRVVMGSSGGGGGASENGWAAVPSLPSGRACASSATAWHW